MSIIITITITITVVGTDYGYASDCSTSLGECLRLRSKHRATRSRTCREDSLSQKQQTQIYVSKAADDVASAQSRRSQAKKDDAPRMYIVYCSILLYYIYYYAYYYIMYVLC